MVKLKRGGNDECYGLARWYRYASDNFYFPRSYFNDISLLQPGQALRHWMLNTAYCPQWHRWRSASCIKILESGAVEPSRVDYISVSCIYGFYTTWICISNYINNVHFIEYSSMPKRARLHSQHKMTMSLNHFRIRLFMTEDGYVPGEERIYRRRTRGVFSLEHDNSMVSFWASSQNWGLTESPSWVLSQYLHFFPSLVCIYPLAYADFLFDGLGTSVWILDPFYSSLITKKRKGLCWEDRI